MYWGSGGIGPRILDLGTRWRWVVSFTPQPLYPQGKSLRYPLDATYVRTRGVKTLCTGKWNHYSESSLYLKLNTIYFITFKCDLKRAVDIEIVWKVSCSHGHPFHSCFIPHEHPLVGVKLMPWFVMLFLRPSFWFWLVGVVCLYGRLSLYCKCQRQSCFLLPVKTYSAGQVINW
jgi:hypothetical protein